MRELYAMAAQVGPSEAPVLIQGETGVGQGSAGAPPALRFPPRAQRPFLKLNCAALPSELVESELFGYERGAFTGAFQRKPGMFEMADGGTLLLDEIGDMDFKLQAKLLQVLQDHEFQRLGGKETVRVDVRVIAATHNDLEKLDRGGHVPPGPVLPAERGHAARSAAARAQGRHPRRWRDSAAQVCPAVQRASGDHAGAASRRCCCTTGRATCGSWKTWSASSWCCAIRT